MWSVLLFAVSCKVPFHWICTESSFFSDKTFCKQVQHRLRKIAACLKSLSLWINTLSQPLNATIIDYIHKLYFAFIPMATHITMFYMFNLLTTVLLLYTQIEKIWTVSHKDQKYFKLMALTSAEAYVWERLFNNGTQSHSFNIRTRSIIFFL